MAQFAYDFAAQVMSSALHWLRSYGLLVIIAVNFAAFACMVLLAWHVRVLSLRILQTRREAKRQRLLLETLTQSHESQTPSAFSIEATNDETPASPFQNENQTSLLAIRQELHLIQTRLCSLQVSGPSQTGSRAGPLALESASAAAEMRKELEALRSAINNAENTPS
jgi:hypothetical protein